MATSLVSGGPFVAANGAAASGRIVAHPGPLTSLTSGARTVVQPARPVLAGRDRSVAHGGDHVAAVRRQLGLLVTVHEVEVELVDAGVGQLAELGDVLVGLAQHAEPVRHLVPDERRVRRADLGVMEVVVPLAVGI